MSSVGQMVRCNVRKEDEKAFRECSGEGRSGSKEAVRQMAVNPWSERVHANVKGKEDAGHECSFYCRCWTDE